MKGISGFFSTRLGSAFAVVFTLFLNVLPSQAANNWYDPNWALRLPVVIDNTANSATLTNYPVKVVLNSGNFDFTKARADGGDIRLTTTDGTSVNYWLEDFNSVAQSGIIWANVPSIPGSSTTTVYLYIGNAAASSASNGSATFDLFDDFVQGVSTSGSNWQRVVVDNNLDGAHNVEVEDIDGDGKPDIVADAYTASTLVWYQQPSDPINGTWIKHVIDSNLANAHDFHIGDIDGDGQRDIVGLSLSANPADYSAGEGYLCWYKKPANVLASGSTGWTSKAPLPYCEGDGSAAIYNGEIYVFGGHWMGVTDPRNEAYKYNVGSNTWTRLTDMPTARWGHIAVECGGFIHVFAGMYSSTATGIHEIYDPTLNTWQSRAQANPLNLPLYGAGGAVHPDVIYFPAGKDGYKYWMVYTPYPPQSGENPSILRSNDGITWTDAGITNPVIPQGTAGSWNVGENADPDFLYAADLNKWFMVWAGQNASGSEGIALAYSSDGKTWTQYNGPRINGNANPVIVSGEDANGQSWERNSSGVSLLQCPTLYYKNGVFYLYYVDEGEGNNAGNAGFATFTWNNTTNSIANFSRCTSNPTIAIGCGHLNLSWDATAAVYTMHAVKGSSLIRMTSPDLVTWSNYVTVLGPGDAGSWDGSYIYRSCPVVDSNGTIVPIGGKTRIYYSANGSLNYRIGIADISTTGDVTRFTGQGPADVPSGLANQGLMGINYNNKIHLFYQHSHYEYDPTTDIYTQKADVPTPRTWTTCALVNNKIYLIGGYSYGSPAGAVNVNEVYDPSTDTWQTKAPMPVSKYGTTRENPVINNQIYVTHGLDGGFHTDNYMYDPASDTWMQKSAGMNPRDGVQAAVLNNKLYVIGGRNDDNNGGTGTNFVEAYDPAADNPGSTWTKTIIAHSGATGLLGARSMGLGDIDKDGNLDIAVAIDGRGTSPTGRLYWYKNPGGANALNPSLWHEYLLDAAAASGADAQIGDIDGDGHPDIVYAGNDAPNPGVYIYFAPSDPTNISAWTKVCIAGNAYHVYLVDFDGDGDLDILRASAYSNSVSWLENPGGAAARNPANWKEYIIEQDASITTANRVAAADIDGDGLLDITMDADPSMTTGIFKWYRRPADPRNIAGWEIHTIDSDPNFTAYAHDSFPADINGDGRIDLAGVGPSAKTVMWWVNSASNSTTYIDPAKWNSNGATVSNGIVNVSGSVRSLVSRTAYQYKALRCKAKFDSYGNWGYIGWNSGKTTVGSNDSMFVSMSTPTVQSITSGSSGFTWGYSQNEGTDWKKWDVMWSPNQVTFAVNDAVRQVHTANIPAIPLNVQFSVNQQAGGTPSVSLDWAAVRSYSIPEPVATPGSIQQYGTAPKILSTAPITAQVGGAYAYQVSASGQSPLTYSLTVLPNGMTVDNSGNIHWTPTADQIGPNAVMVTVSNGVGSDAQSFTITVTDPFGAWGYCASVNIDNTGNSNALINYPVRINLNSSNFDFTKAAAGGQDIRFTAADKTILSQWIESWDQAGTSAIVWVKVPSIPASGTAVIYMYLGDSNATDISNGNSTFDFFDDFSGAALDPVKWTNSGGSVSGGIASVSTAGAYIRSVNQYTYESLRCRGKFEVYQNYGYIGFNSAKLTVGKNDATFLCFGTPTVQSITSGASSFTWGYNLNEGTDWKIWDVLWKAGEVKFVVNDVLRQTHTTNIPAVPLNVQINTYSSNPTVRADWILVRQYSTPEPISSVGSAQKTHFTITISADPNGVVNPSGTIYKSVGSSQTFTATANSGYQVDTWYLDGSPVATSSNSYSLSNIQGDHAVRVTFKVIPPIMHTVTATAGTHGSIQPSGQTSVVDRSSIQFTAMPDQGYNVDTWTVDGNVAQSGSTAFTLSNIICDHAVQVSFKALGPFTISGTVGIAGVALNGLPGTPVTTEDGTYSASVPYGWSGTVVPSRADYVFTPPQRNYTGVTANITNQGYSPQNIYDLNGDKVINLGDIATFLSHWLESGSNVTGDFNHDGTVNLLDLATLIEKCN